MYRFLLIIPALFLFSGCVNKHGVSAKYYSDCKEYYDLQGYYHKDCGEDDMFTYKGVIDGTKKFINGDKKPQGNVIGIDEEE